MHTLHSAWNETTAQCTSLPALTKETKTAGQTSQMQDHVCSPGHTLSFNSEGRYKVPDPCPLSEGIIQEHGCWLGEPAKQNKRQLLTEAQQLAAGDTAELPIPRSHGSLGNAAAD